MATDFDRIRGLTRGCVSRAYRLLSWIKCDQIGIEDVGRNVISALAELRESLVATKPVIERIGDAIATPGLTPFFGVSGRSYSEIAYRFAREVYLDALAAVDAPRAFHLDGDETGTMDFAAITCPPIADIRMMLGLPMPSETEASALIASADAEACQSDTAPVSDGELNASGEAMEMLFGWPEILDTIKRPNDDTDRVKRLNAAYEGPIQTRQGGDPMVKRGALVTWWNSLDDRVAASQKRQRGRDGDSRREL